MSDSGKPDNTRRSFIRTSTAGAATVGLFGGLASALEAFANTREDAAMIRKAVSNVEAAAKKGAKGEALSLVANYRKLGGRNRVVAGALKSVDESLAKANAFQEYDRERIGRAVSSGLKRHIQGVGDISGNEVNCGLKAGDPIKGTALETMVEFGGSSTADALRERGLK